MIKKEIEELVEISRFYGKNSDFVIAGGGNTSYKDEERLWIKASGTALASIDSSGFVEMDRNRLKQMAIREYSSDPVEREKQVKTDLYSSCSDPGSGLRPSVETNLHDVIGYSFVVHLHPTIINGLMCGKNSRSITARLFDDALYIEYIDPGYTLFCKVRDEIRKYHDDKGYDPKIIFLENHGVFVAADSTKEIRELYSDIFSKTESLIKDHAGATELPLSGNNDKLIPAVRMMLSSGSLKTVVVRHNSLISSFYEGKDSFARVSAPFTPDIIVYCKSRYLYIDKTGTPEEIALTLQERISGFIDENGYYPRIILIKDVGLLAAGDNWQSAETSLDVFEDLMKISLYSESFGGPRFMTSEQIAFIDEWEVENYRRKIATGPSGEGRAGGRIAIVTGGAMGFGAGIAESLYSEGANVIIADINEKEGYKRVEEFNRQGRKNRAAFVRTDTSDYESVISLIRKSVVLFGGLDLMVANAGILYAGGLDEMSPQVFEKVTDVNYKGYFLCVKYASEVMRLQHKYKNDHYSDIIQINSKSGLKGSNRNFAYAGGKFGGIGLTQSFAMELMPFNIKVNSICPGNFFEGPLWSDPENGLFVQYLHAGKVPGAKTIEDVRKHYEKQVPAGRGCRVEDVMKAVYYVIDQQYETGQAVPVTGGQIMLH